MKINAMTYQTALDALLCYMFVIMKSMLALKSLELFLNFSDY